MKPAEARAVVASLVSAYPSATIRQETIDLYSTQIAKLQSTEAAIQAVQELIGKPDPWFPTFGQFRAAYAMAAKRIADERDAELRRNAQERGLPEGDRPPIPEFVLDFAAGLGSSGGPSPEQEARALEQVGEGECADCLQRFDHRVRFGTLEVCARCVIPRLRVARVTA